MRSTPSPAPSKRQRDDSGASVVEFVLMATLLLMLLFGSLQVSVFLYARSVTAAAAADGSRYAASSGLTPVDGAQRADELVRAGLHRAATAIPCTGTTTVDARSGLGVTTVHCRGRLRTIFLPLPVPWWVDATSSSLTERTP